MARTRRVATRKGKKGRSAASGSRAFRPMRVAPLGNIFPDRVVVTMPYGEMILRSPAAVTDQYNFLINSTFDPDSTGVGHQPLGRDQWAAIYGKYRVLHVKMTFELALPSPWAVAAYICFSNDSTTLGATDLLEQPWTVYKFAKDPSYGQPTRLVLSANLWDVWGKSREQYLSDDITAANNAASPSETIYGKIGLAQSDRTTSITSWAFCVRIEQTVEWFDRQFVGAS